MANKWHCDVCGKETCLIPETEAVYEEREVEMPVPVPDKKAPGGMRLEMQKMKQKVPVMVSMRQQDVRTGEIKMIQVPSMKELQPKAIIVALKCGDERIQKDFCRECFAKFAESKAKELWDLLENIKSVE